MPGTVARMLPYPRDAGMAAMTSLSITFCVRVLVCTSTTGVSPVTVIVSCTPPTRMSALIVMLLAPPLTSTPSRITVVKPGSVKVNLYVPGVRSWIRYRPVPSDTVVRTFSINAGLAASTVTPGSTAPEASRTVPARD